MVELIPLVGHRHRVNDLPVGREPGFTSITASASGFEKSGLSSKVYAKFSGGASIASFGDAWKVGSGLIVIGMAPVGPTLSSCISPRAKEGEFRSSAYG